MLKAIKTAKLSQSRLRVEQASVQLNNLVSDIVP